MPNKDNSKMNATAVLDKKRIKATRQRIAILEILSEMTYPVTAEEIYMHTRYSLKSSLSTIYRTLDLLVDKGIAIRGMPHDTGKAVYELSGDIHKHHLICLTCKKMLVIEGCPLEAYEKSLQSKTGYSIVEHRLDLYGVCPDCQRETK
jgi:Fur family transcriptional regulator, ferric uptake regulator